MFDFRTVKSIREVRIITQNYDWSPDLPTAAQVKVGDAPPAIIDAGVFSTFRFFGELPDSVQHSTTYVLKRERPMKGRYLLIQKPGAVTNMVLCYVMAL